MKTLYTALILSALVGCGGGSGGGSSDSSPYVKPNESSKHFNMWYDPALASPFADVLEQYWVEVQTCAGISAPVINHKVSVRYIPADQMRIETGYYTYSNDTITIDERYLAERIVVKHEMLHHLLDIVGTPVDTNSAHEPEWLFNQCIYE